MMTEIAEPMATGTVQWLTAEQGGRRSGPPTVPVYIANCTFPLGGEADLVPGWPATAEKFTLLLQKNTENHDGSWECWFGFIAPDLVSEYLVVGADMLIMEGPKVVGHATIRLVA